MRKILYLKGKTFKKFESSGFETNIFFNHRINFQTQICQEGQLCLETRPPTSTQNFWAWTDPAIHM